jgi:hypothetical protein
VYKYENWV